MKRYTRLYLGLVHGGMRREVFRSATEPTDASHGHRYAAVIGPFRTVRAAALMLSIHSPVHSVREAERYAKEVIRSAMGATR